MYYSIIDNKKNRFVFISRNSSSKEELLYDFTKFLVNYISLDKLNLTKKDIDSILRNKDYDFMNITFNKFSNLDIIEHEYYISMLDDKSYTN